MTREEIYDIWAPPGATWSPWVKPVLFAHIGLSRPGLLPATPGQFDIPWLGRDSDPSILILDLPGPLAVYLGLQLARENGYRPVPLYNACPPSIPSSPFAPSPPAPSQCALDVYPIIEALDRNAPTLANLRLPDDAPPAFLLDSDRRVGSPPFRPTPGNFDNRWVSLTTDFPSANLLLSLNLKRAILIQVSSLKPEADLAHTLFRWQEAGIAIEAVALAAVGTSPERILVNRPIGFRLIWQRTLALMGLRPNPLGGFGGVLPVPSSSSG